jgi:hypothetical protein
MNNDKALEISTNTGIKASDELHDLTENYRTLRTIGNQTIIGRGKILEEVYQRRLWKAQNYDSYFQCIADPNGFDTRPRTANMYRLLYRVWAKKLAKLGVTEQDINQVDSVKLAYVARAIMAEQDSEKMLELLHRAKTLTLRELQDDQEAEHCIVSRGACTIQKGLQEKNKQLITLLVEWHPDMSIQNFMQTFGSNVCELKLWIAREEKDD